MTCDARGREGGDQVGWSPTLPSFPMACRHRRWSRGKPGREGRDVTGSEAKRRESIMLGGGRSGGGDGGLIG